MGQVKLPSDTGRRRGQIVAIKKIKLKRSPKGMKWHLPTPAVLASLIQSRALHIDLINPEIDALLQVATKDHPGIMSLYDAFLTSSEVSEVCEANLPALKHVHCAHAQLLLVTEFCNGGELFTQLCTRGAYDEHEVRGHPRIMLSYDIRTHLSFSAIASGGRTHQTAVRGCQVHARAGYNPSVGAQY